MSKAIDINEYFFSNHVEAAMMDKLWSLGWRHFGSYFYRYSKIPQEHGLYTVLPLRIRLDDFLLKRRHKRTLQKNQDIKLRIEPAFVNDAVESLLERHKTRFTHSIPDSIYTFVSSMPSHVPCTCLSLCLYLDDVMVGVSYLDVGERACSSVYQCFDPELESRALGILMVLLSIEQSIKMGKTFYYPGYAYIEPSHYDYKKQFVGLEGFDWQRGWLKQA